MFDIVFDIHYNFRQFCTEVCGLKRRDILAVGIILALAICMIMIVRMGGGSKTPNGGNISLPTEAAQQVEATQTAAPDAPKETAPTATPTPAPANTGGAAKTKEPAKTETEGKVAVSTPGATSMIMRPAVPTLAPAEAYLSLQIQNVLYDPIPLLGEADLPVEQPNGKKNVVALTRGSIQMKSSNCDNQQCVHQGIVTLENRDERVLMDMIICLPNQVTLRLLTPEEAQQQWMDVYGKK